MNKKIKNNQQINVLSIIHYPVFGGPHNRNLKINPTLKNKNNINTWILLPDDQGNAFKRLQDAGIKTIKLPLSRIRNTKNIFYYFGFPFLYLRDIFNIYKLIKEKSIDIIQLNGYANLQGLFAAKLAKKKIIIQIIDTYTPKGLIVIYKLFMMFFVEVFMSTGKTVANYHLGDMNAKHIFYFFPPVNLKLHKPVKGKSFYRRKALQSNFSGTIIGTLGNINKQKGHVLFIRAASEFLKLFPSHSIQKMTRKS